MVEGDLALPAGFVVFSGPDDDEGLAAARAYANQHNLTQQHVRMYRSEGSVCLQLKVDVTYPCGKRSKPDESNYDGAVPAGSDSV